MLEPIISFLLMIMNLTHQVTGTWVIDIILLTLLVRLAMFPLNRKMTMSMKAMQKLQPEMKELQEKFKDNPQEMQKRTMELYKKHNANPFMACLPMAVQMPVFFALFWALRDPRYFLRLPGYQHATLFGTDLSVTPFMTSPTAETAFMPGVLDLFAIWDLPFLADKFLYLPSIWLVVLYAVSIFFQSRMMQAQSQAQTAPGQPNIQNMMMPMFLFFGFILPTGLLVYFITSNVLMIGQYWGINREVAAEEALAETQAIEEAGKPSPPGFEKGTPSKKKKDKKKKK